MYALTTMKIKTGLAIALFASALAWLALADGALGATGGNAARAKLCQKGGWSTLMDSSGQQFAGEDACVSYAAHDGAVYALATLDVQACQNQPYDGLCVNTSGSGLQPGSVVTATLSKNGSPVREDYPIVLGDGTLASSPTAHFEFPCVADNVYSASATGTSADSLTSPMAPGIPITSKTVQRTSACP
jgi:hypothetical protein